MKPGGTWVVLGTQNWLAWIAIWRMDRRVFHDHGTLHKMAVLNPIKTSVDLNHIRTRLDSKR